MTVKKKKQNREEESRSDFDYAAYEKEVVSGLIEGKALMGEGGLLKPLIAKFVESALDAELSYHLEEEAKGKPDRPNKKNGLRQKKLRSEAG
jgi:putative transposase